jgi:hypothetical protein
VELLGSSPYGELSPSGASHPLRLRHVVTSPDRRARRRIIVPRAPVPSPVMLDALLLVSPRFIASITWSSTAVMPRWVFSALLQHIHATSLTLNV